MLNTNVAKLTNEKKSGFATVIADKTKKIKLNNKILLFQLPQTLFSSMDKKAVLNRACYAWPPAGLMCLQECLKDSNYNVTIVDLNYILLKEIINNKSFDIRNWYKLADKYLDMYKPSIVGVSTISVSLNPDDKEYHLTLFLNYLKSINKYVVVSGGVNATEHRTYLLENKLSDFVIAKESEYKFKFLVDALHGKYNDADLPSEIFYIDRGMVSETAGINKKVNVNYNIIDSYKKLDIETYNDVGSLNPFSRMAGQNKKYATLQLNRGCRADCKFCGVGEFMGGQGVRTAPVELIIKELQYLVTERNISHFEFLDDDLLGGGRCGLDAVKTLFKEMSKLREKYGITWSAGNGLIAAGINDEIMSLIYESGCIAFRIGIESANPKMLKIMRKPTSLRRLFSSSHVINKYPEIYCGANYIIGLYGIETWGEMLDTYEFTKIINLDWSSFSTYQFTSKDNEIRKNIQSDGKSAAEFMPAKNRSYNKINTSRGVLEGFDIFELDLNSVPSKEQVKEIWFTFNFLSNYVNNKNFRPSGNCKKITKWINATMLSYPSNPYMLLFSALGHLLQNDKIMSEKMLKKSQQCLEDSYWKRRFKQFSLDCLLNNFPSDREGVFESLKTITGYAPDATIAPSNVQTINKNIKKISTLH
jgi:radical SAM superfamily enzyme YgiQ (UPF0313 family)